jgi:hypothetical protein
MKASACVRSKEKGLLFTKPGNKTIKKTQSESVDNQ